MVLFPVTLDNPYLRQTTPFSMFCIAFHIFVMGRDTLQNCLAYG